MNHFPHRFRRRFEEPLFCMVLLAAFGFASLNPAAIIGTNSPVLPLSAKRIASIPAGIQTASKEYLEHSERQRKTDRFIFQSEMKDHDIKQSATPPTRHASQSMPLSNGVVW